MKKVKIQVGSQVNSCRVRKIDLKNQTLDNKPISNEELSVLKVRLAQAGLDGYTEFREVCTHYERPVMYLASGYKCPVNGNSPREIVPVYTNGKVSGVFGKNIQEAIQIGVNTAIYYI